MTVAQMMPECDTFYDIGTDHGILPAHMIESGKCQRAVLCDISEKSLDKARRLFERRGIDGVFVRTDGLTGLAPGPADAIALCGMGAHTALNILREGLPCRAVFQPSARVELLRAGLAERGVRVLRECLAMEAGRFYVCLLAEPGEAEPLDDRAAYLGMLREVPLYPEYLAWQRAVLNKALAGGSPDPALRRRLTWIEEETCALS